MGGSGKTETTVGYQYYVGMHHAFCHGPVDALTQILVDGKEAWSGWSTGGRVTINQPELFGGESREGGISGDIDFEVGEKTQGQNDYLANILGSDLLPAFRGVCSAVLRQMYLGMNPYLKNWSWKLSRIHVRQGGIPQWYDEKAEIVPRALAGVSPYMTYYYGLPVSIWGSDDLHMIPGSHYAYHVAGGRYCWKLDIYTHEVVGLVDYDDWFLGCHSCLSQDGSKLYFQNGSYGLCSLDTETLEVTAGPGSSEDYGCLNLTVGDKYIFGGRMLSGADVFVWDKETLVYIGKFDNVDCQQGEIQQVSIDLANDSVWALEAKHTASLDQSGAFIIYNSYTEQSGFWDISAEFPGGATNLCYDPVTRCCFVADNNKLIKWSVDTKTTVDSILISVNYGYSSFQQGVINGELCIINQVSNEAWWISAETLTVNRTVSLAADYGVYPSGAIYDPVTESLIVGNMSGATDIVQLQYQKIPGDMNPSHIIRECLTDPDWGMGYPESAIDDASFTYAANTLYGESMGISILWDQASDIKTFVVDILRHIEAVLYINRRTGKFVLRLIRNDYDAETLLELNETNVSRVENFSRLTMAELTNEVIVRYWSPEDRQIKTTLLQDVALVQAMGMVSSATMDYVGFTNADIADRVAQRDLKTLSTPHLTCEIYTNRQASEVNIGDAIKLSWPALNVDSVIMRISGISMGSPTSSEIRLECIQDVFSMPDVNMMEEPDIAWEPPPTVPVKPLAQLAVEAPYYELVQIFGQDFVDSKLVDLPEAGYLVAAAVRPNSVALNAKIFTDSGAGYVERGSADFCPSSVTTSAIWYTDTVLPLESLVDADLITKGTWVQVDDELMVVESVSTSSITVRRGILDTVPACHVVSSRLFHWDAYFGGDAVEYVLGDSINVRLCTVTGAGTLPLGSAILSNVVMAQRAYSPYPPGNLKINAISYPTVSLEGELSITWAHRDRTQQTSGSYEDYTYGDIGPEIGVTYRLRGYAEDTLIWTEEPISGTATTWIPSGCGTVRVEVDALRDGVYSWQPANCEFEYTVPFDVQITEDVNIRVTESGTIIRLEGI